MITVPFDDEITELTDRAVYAVGERLRERIVLRIGEQIYQELRQGLPIEMPSSEHAALEMMKAIARQLHQAGVALGRAAADLKHAGKGVQANQAHLASRAALQAANEITGDNGE